MPVCNHIYYFQSHNGGGESPPIVLIHGAGGTHLNWPAEIRRLPNNNIYAVDLPGHGRSEGRGLQTIEGYADSLLEWLESMGLYRAIFIGHSMGGAIAIKLAITHPEHTIALGLIGTGGRLRVANNILENTASAQTLPSALSIINASAFSKHANPRLVELASKRLAETRPSVLHGDLLACNQFDAMDALHQINRPTLVICGHDDQMTPFRYSQYLADNIPGAMIKGIPEAGHMVMLEQPHIVMDTIMSFVSTIHFHPGDTIPKNL